MKILIIMSLMTSLLIHANELEDKELLKRNFDAIMQEKADEIEKAEVEYSLWTKGLNQFLSEHSNPNVRVLAFQYLIRVTESLPEAYATQVIENQDQLESMISDWLNDKQISPQTLMILESICQSNRLTKQCDKDLISQTRIEKEPDNISSYLAALERAIKQSDKEEIKEILSMMTKARFDNNHYYVILELEQAIRNYEKQAPFPQSYIDTNKSMYQELIGVSDSKLQDMFDNMQEYMLLGLFVGYKVALPQPNYRPIMTACETLADVNNDCMKISSILQKNSFSVLGTVLGNAVQLKLLESSGHQKAYQELKQKDEAFSRGFNCLSQSLYSNENSLDNSFSLEYYQMANKLEREKGELASLIKQAELNYNYQISKGYQQAVNPKKCFE